MEEVNASQILLDASKLIQENKSVDDIDSNAPIHDDLDTLSAAAILMILDDQPLEIMAQIILSSLLTAYVLGVKSREPLPPSINLDFLNE